VYISLRLLQNGAVDQTAQQLKELYGELYERSERLISAIQSEYLSITQRVGRENIYSLPKATIELQPPDDNQLTGTALNEMVESAVNHNEQLEFEFEAIRGATLQAEVARKYLEVRELCDILAEITGQPNTHIAPKLPVLQTTPSETPGGIDLPTDQQILDCIQAMTDTSDALDTMRTAVNIELDRANAASPEPSADETIQSDEPRKYRSGLWAPGEEPPEHFLDTGTPKKEHRAEEAPELLEMVRQVLKGAGQEKNGGLTDKQREGLARTITVFVLDEDVMKKVGDTIEALANPQDVENNQP